MAKRGNLLGSWAFLIGVVLAFILGILGTNDPMYVSILVFIGLIIGLLNIADEEVHPFLMSGAVLIIASALGRDAISDVMWVSNILKSLLAIFVPATVIVAIKNVFSLAKR